MSAFFTLHQGLEREGPGEPADIAWVADLVDLAPNARICDAACGPGADVLTWLNHAPEGHVTAIDAHKPFIDELHGRIGPHPQVTAYVGNMAKLKGPFDLIWCAGAVYFLGIEKALNAWRPCLTKGGAIAFSEPCFFVDQPSDAALAYWEDYATMGEAGIRSRIRAAGYEVVDTRRISDAAWQIYHSTMQTRIDALRDGAGAELSVVLDLGQQEIDMWQAVKHETGYLLCVVRPA